MIIDVPFTSRVSVIPPRARLPRFVWVNDSHPFNIREINVSSFPLAAMYHSRYREEFRNHDEPEPIHHDGKRFFRRAQVQDFTALENGVLDKNGHTPFSSDQYLAVGQQEGVERKLLVGRVVEDPRPQRVTVLAAAAARTVLCDGAVYVACGEPCFRWVNGAFAIEPVLLDANRFYKEPSIYCRADRISELIRPSFHGEDEPEILGSLEILRPDLLELSPAAPILVDIAVKRMSSLGLSMSRNVMFTTREDFETFVTLRECVMVTSEGNPTFDTKEIARNKVSPALAAIVAVMLKENPSQMSGRLKTAYDNWLVDSAQEIENKPIKNIPGIR